MKRKTKKRLGILLIVLGTLGIVLEFILIITYDKYLSLEWAHPESRWNYLAFFTQLTNITVDLWLIVLGIALLINIKKQYRFLTKAHVQGALTLYILVVGLVYCAILFPVTRDVYSGRLWWGNVINIWHHVVVPIVMVVMWWRMPHKGHVSKTTLLYWMIYPMAYLVFSEIRGLITGWFPYPFLDWNTEMLGGWLFPLGLASLVGLFAGLGYIMIWFHNSKIRRRRKRPIAEAVVTAKVE